MREWTLDIGGKEWAIKFVQPSRLPDDTEGMCYLHPKKIHVANNLAPERETLQIGHEIIHARLWDLDHAAVYELAEATNTAFWRSVNAK